MKKAFYRSLLAVTAFIVTYIALSFLIPGWRIKLEAEPLVYFMASLKHMAAVKLVISFFASLLVAKISGLLTHK